MSAYLVLFPLHCVLTLNLPKVMVAKRCPLPPLLVMHHMSIVFSDCCLRDARVRTSLEVFEELCRIMNTEDKYTCLDVHFNSLDSLALLTSIRDSTIYL